MSQRSKTRVDTRWPKFSCLAIAIAAAIHGARSHAVSRMVFHNFLIDSSR